MLKQHPGKIFKRKKSKLKITPGEEVRDAIIKSGIEVIKESGYVTDNNTEKVITMAEKVGTVLDRGVEWALGSESANALGKIGFKTTKDISRGDPMCTGLCLVSGTCESIAICCSTIKIIPFRGKIFVSAKIISKGCMTFRNSCTGEGC